MRVSTSTNNSTQRSAKFNGNFKDSHCLQKVINQSGVKELQEFNKILKRMKATNDGLSFFLRENEAKVTKGMEITFMSKDKEGNPMRLFNTLPSFGYEGVMGKINEKLKEFYPEQTNTKSKKEVVEDINKLLAIA